MMHQVRLDRLIKTEREGTQGYQAEMGHQVRLDRLIKQREREPRGTRQRWGPGKAG